MLKSYNLISVELPSFLTYRLQLIPVMLLESRVHVDERWQTPSPSSSWGLVSPQYSKETQALFASHFNLHSSISDSLNLSSKRLSSPIHPFD